MRKKCLVALLLTCILVLASVCSPFKVEPTDVTQQPPSNPVFPFATILLQSEYFDLFVKESEYSEQACEKLFQQIHGDIEHITRKTSSTGAKVVLCMTDSVTMDYYSAKSAELYCTSQQIQNGDYRRRLLEEMYDLHDYGTLAGLCSYLFSDNREKATTNLSDYYSDTAHLPTLSLFAAYFNESFADSETVAAAEETATQFVGYMLDTYGIQCVLSCGFSEEPRTEWLRSIGVSETYQNIYETVFLKDVIYRESNQYPLVLLCGAHRYNFIPITNFSTPAEVWKALAQYNAGVQNMLKYVQENAPSSYDKVLSNWQKPLVTTFWNQRSGEVSGSINVYRLTDWFHETAHFLLERLEEKDGIWTQEGMATYLSCFAGETFDGDLYYSLLMLDYTQFEESQSKDVALWLVDYYDTHWKQEVYNQLVYFRGWGVFPDLANLPVPNDFNVILKSCADRRNEISGGNYINQDGNELTYFQAALVFDYLSVQFGMDNVLVYYFDDTSDLSNYFNINYIEALKAAEYYFADTPTAH